MRRALPLLLAGALGACQKTAEDSAPAPVAAEPQAPQEPARFASPSGFSVRPAAGWFVSERGLQRRRPDPPFALAPRLRWTTESADSPELEPNVRRSLRALRSLKGGGRLTQSSLSRRQLGPTPVAELDLIFSLKRGGRLHQRSLLFIPDATEIPPTLVGLHASYLDEDRALIEPEVNAMLSSLRRDPQAP